MTLTDYDGYQNADNNGDDRDVKRRDDEAKKGIDKEEKHKTKVQ